MNEARRYDFVWRSRTLRGSRHVPSHPYFTPHGTPYPPSAYLLVPCTFGLCQSNVHPNGEPIQRAERRERTSWGMPGRVRNELSVCLSNPFPTLFLSDGNSARLPMRALRALRPTSSHGLCRL